MTPKYLLLTVCFSWLLTSCYPATPKVMKASSSTLPPSTSSTPISTGVPSVTPTIVPTATVIPLPFAQPRAKSHQLLFADSTFLSMEHIYLFDYESAQSSLKVDLINTSKSFFRIVSGYSSLSPDAQILSVIDLSRGREPTFINQVDIPQSKVETMLIAQDFRWNLPLVVRRMPPLSENPTPTPVPPGVRPVLGLPSGVDDVGCNLDFDYDHPLFKWAPDGYGFAFTISQLGGCALRARPVERAQLYFVPRLGTKAEALALDAPLDAVGLYAKWSPDGKSILFANRAKGIFVVDKAGFGATTSFPQTANYNDVAEAWWAPDGQSIVFQAGYINGVSSVVQPYEVEGISNLYWLDLATGKVQPLTHDLSVGNIGHWIENKFLAWANKGRGVVFLRGEWDEKIVGNTVYRSYRYYLDMDTGATRLLTNVSVPYLVTRYTKVFENYLLLLTDVQCSETRQFTSEYTGYRFKVLSLPKGEVVFDPGDKGCIAMPYWSPDGHLIAGHSGGDIVIWDLDTKTKTVISNVGGEKTIIGWIPDPANWGKTLPTKTP